MPFGVSCATRASIYKGAEPGAAVTDTGLVPKSADLIGLYLNPPLNAAILGASAMSGPQAIERQLGYVETDSGAVARALKKSHRRNGVLRLSAALEAGTGQRRTKLTEHQRRADFRDFLDGIVAEQLAGREIHAIVDSGSMNREWLAAVDCARQVSLHANSCPVAHPDRDPRLAF